MEQSSVREKGKKVFYHEYRSLKIMRPDSLSRIRPVIMGNHEKTVLSQVL
jgi:hypothetical protein